MIDICRGDRPVALAGTIILRLTIGGPASKNPPPVAGWGIFVSNGPMDYFPSFNVFERSSDGKANSRGISA
jgi:hypothetical protein